MRAIFVFVATYLSCFILDMLWLGFFSTALYKNAIGPLMRKSGELAQPNWPAAFLVYLFITIGIMTFVLNKSENSYFQTTFWGAIFGLVLYGVYDFTNYAVLDKWPLTITLIDFMWGIVLCALSSLVASWAQNAFTS